MLKSVAVFWGFFGFFNFGCSCFYRDDSWSPAPLVCSKKTLLWNHHCLERINVLGFRELVLPTKILPHEPLTKYWIASPPPSNESDSIENVAVFQIKPQTMWHDKVPPALLKEPNKGPIFCSFHQLWWRHINEPFLSVPFRQPKHHNEPTSYPKLLPARPYQKGFLQEVPVSQDIQQRVCFPDCLFLGFCETIQLFYACFRYWSPIYLSNMFDHIFSFHDFVVWDQPSEALG